MTPKKPDLVIVVRWPCCDGMHGYTFEPVKRMEYAEHFTCSYCGTRHRIDGPLIKYKDGPVWAYWIPEAWTMPLADADAVSSPMEIAAERLGVTPASLRAEGMDEKWFSNPENMPPPPGSGRWIRPGHPLRKLLDE